MNPSGGLRWHWRAWRSRTLWAPTCTDIAAWLAQVQPRSKELILLGPSAGWMLPTDWLLRFERIHAVDIDPWAARFFKYRHGAALQAGGTRWDYQTGDALADLPRLLTVHPQACVLFDNLLGQLRFHAPRWQDPLTFTAQQLADVQRLLRGREWGSVHDLLSGPAQGLARGHAFPAARLPGMASTNGAAPSRQLDTAWLAAAGVQGEWLDHLTEHVFPAGTPVRDIAWAFSPRYWHWLQAGWVTPPAK
jgi:hypothetical protein